VIAPLRTARALRVLGLSIALIVTLAACRVESVVTLNVKPNGSGTVAVVTTANAAVVAAIPNLAEQLALDDLKTAGWEISDVVSTEDGKLQVRVAKQFATPDEATLILNELSAEYGPFRNMSLVREGKDTDSSWTLNGDLQVTGGLNAFADSALVALIGGAPFEDALVESGQDIGQAVGITFKAVLPGDVVSTTGLDEAGTLRWNVAFDGSTQSVAAVTQNTAVASTIAGIFEPVLRWMLILWFVAMILFAALVTASRIRRSKRTPTA
jgi:hypothetical protein